jgi:Domain of unknown function (DUF4326)
MSDAKTQVVNIRREAFDVYIGRRGHGHDGYFGNPFRTPPLAREEALARYRASFHERLKNDPQFRRRVLALKGKRLGCFCAPLACHGDVIAQWLERHPAVPAA